MTDLSSEDFKYDVAFSFLGEDEALAQQLNDLLHDRLRTFIYTRRQEQIAGTDGELSLNQVFGSEVRLVVVLYRERWGSTPFTRIEETAIRNRAYEEGYDFTIFVPLGGSPPPRWLPRTRIWPNLERWGMDGLAAVIESRVQELGGISRSESPIDRAVRLQREIEAERERKEFLGSSAGVQAANELYDRLCGEIEGLVANLNERSPLLKISYRRGLLSAGRLALVIQWDNYSLATLEGSTLRISGYVTGGESLGGVVADFDRRPDQELGWRIRGNERFYTNKEMAGFCINYLLEKIRTLNVR